MSELDDRFVYRGVWTNRDYGRIMGHTITTDVETSIIIVALLAIVSSFLQQKSSGQCIDTV
jgi:NADH:ubiquinone oxidoreductase subunit F (NADH-binding)